jgi:selenocysteine-specific translation elongation factor
VTGTVVEGHVKVGDEVEFPLINEKKVVKSIQMFKK